MTVFVCHLKSKYSIYDPNGEPEDKVSLLIQDKLRIHQQKMDALTHQLDKSHPKNLLRLQKDSMSAMQNNLRKTFKNLWQMKLNQHNHLSEQLLSHQPSTRLESQKLKQLSSHLDWQVRNGLKTAKQSLSLAANNLNNQSPLNVLARGYSITSNLENNEVISDISQINVGDQVSTQLKSGRILAKIFERLED